MNRDVQNRLKAYRSAVGTADIAVAEESLWLAIAKWRDDEVEKALKRVEVLARNQSAGNVADQIRELIDQRESFEGTFDGEN